MSPTTETDNPARHEERSESERLQPGAVLTIIVLLCAAFVVILNETILNVALPRLIDSLGVDANVVQWVATGFMLTMAVVIPTTGFIIGRLGTRGAFALAMISFTCGTAIAAAAPGFGLLLAGRIVQGIGSAIMLPLLITTVLTLVPIAKRGAVMGNVTIVIAVAPALGPTISGLILAHFAWRFLFLFVLPFAIIATILGIARLRGGAREHQPLDVVSVLLSVPGFAGVVYGLSSLGETSSSTTARVAGLGALLVGLILVSVFALRQVRLQRAGAPLLNLSTFRYSAFRTSVGLLSVSMLALFGVVIVLPIYMQSVRGLDSITTGLVLLPGGLAMGLAGPAIGRLFDRIGARPITVTGSIVMATVLLLLTFIGTTTPVWALVLLQLCFSLALACIFTPVFTASLNPLPERLYPHGSAILSTLQQVAAAAGTALLVAVMQIAASAASDTANPHGEQLLPGVHMAFLVALILSVVAIVLAFLMPGRQRTEQQLVAEDAGGAAPHEVPGGPGSGGASV